MNIWTSRYAARYSRRSLLAYILNIEKVFSMCVFLCLHLTFRAIFHIHGFLNLFIFRLQPSIGFYISLYFWSYLLIFSSCKIWENAWEYSTLWRRGMLIYGLYWFLPVIRNIFCILSHTTKLCRFGIIDRGWVWKDQTTLAYFRTYPYMQYHQLRCLDTHNHLFRLLI